MEKFSYGFRKELKMQFEQALKKCEEELKKEGFGIITRIDVKKTMKEKIGEEYEGYVIFGACNPEFAHRALQCEKSIGLLLPCNIIVYADGGKVFVEAINPSAAMGMVENKELEKIAKEVGEKLMLVVSSV